MNFSLNIDISLKLFDRMESLRLTVLSEGNESQSISFSSKQIKDFDAFKSVICKILLMDEASLHIFVSIPGSGSSLEAELEDADDLSSLR